MVRYLAAILTVAIVHSLHKALKEEGNADAIQPIAWIVFGFCAMTYWQSLSPKLSAWGWRNQEKYETRGWQIAGRVILVGVLLLNIWRLGTDVQDGIRQILFSPVDSSQPASAYADIREAVNRAEETGGSPYGPRLSTRKTSARNISARASDDRDFAAESSDARDEADAENSGEAWRSSSARPNKSLPYMPIVVWMDSLGRDYGFDSRLFGVAAVMALCILWLWMASGTLLCYSPSDSQRLLSAALLVFGAMLILHEPLLGGRAAVDPAMAGTWLGLAFFGLLAGRGRHALAALCLGFAASCTPWIMLIVPVYFAWLAAGGGRSGNATANSSLDEKCGAKGEFPSLPLLLFLLPFVASLIPYWQDAGRLVQNLVLAPFDQAAALEEEGCLAALPGLAHSLRAMGLGAVGPLLFVCLAVWELRRILAFSSGPVPAHYLLLRMGLLVLAGALLAPLPSFSALGCSIPLFAASVLAVNDVPALPLPQPQAQSRRNTVLLWALRVALVLLIPGIIIGVYGARAGRQISDKVEKCAAVIQLQSASPQKESEIWEDSRRLRLQEIRKVFGIPATQRKESRIFIRSSQPAEIPALRPNEPPPVLQIEVNGRTAFAGRLTTQTLQGVFFDVPQSEWLIGSNSVVARLGLPAPDPSDRRARAPQQFEWEQPAFNPARWLPAIDSLELSRKPIGN